MSRRSSFARRFPRTACLFAVVAIMTSIDVRGESPLVNQTWADDVPSSRFSRLVAPSSAHSAATASPGEIGAASCYWIVSSRHLPQGVAGGDSGQLGYFERLSDGRLRHTSRQAMATQMMPGVPICLFIHGSFVTAVSHERESAQTYDWIRRPAPQFPLQVIFYTWPSEARFNNLASLNSMAVNLRGYWAENNAFFLADLVAHLPANCPICLVGHSHGVRVAAAALHLIAGGQIEGRTYSGDTGIQRRFNAVLAAGAIDRNWLNPGQRYDFAAFRVDAILNLVNRTDAALHFYHLSRPFARRAIAATGLTRWDRIRLGTLGNKVVDCDVTELIGVGHFWPNYYEQPSLADLITPYVYFTNSQAALSNKTRPGASLR